MVFFLNMFGIIAIICAVITTVFATILATSNFVTDSSDGSSMAQYALVAIALTLLGEAFFLMAYLSQARPLQF